MADGSHVSLSNDAMTPEIREDYSTLHADNANDLVSDEPVGTFAKVIGIVTESTTPAAGGLVSAFFNGVEGLGVVADVGT